MLDNLTIDWLYNGPYTNSSPVFGEEDGLVADSTFMRTFVGSSKLRLDLWIYFVHVWAVGGLIIGIV